MDDYNLAPGECIVAQDWAVFLCEGDDVTVLDEVVLTNQNLILVATMERGNYKRARYLKRYPLKHIARQQDVPQVVAATIHGQHLLQVGFREESVVLQFVNSPRRTAERWARYIQRAANDVPLEDITKDKVLPSEKRNKGKPLGQRSQGSQGVVADKSATSKSSENKAVAKKPASKSEAKAETKTSAKAKSAPTEPPKNKVTARCVGCHAPLVGSQGSIVTCSYCDTKQTL